MSDYDFNNPSNEGQEQPQQNGFDTGAQERVEGAYRMTGDPYGQGAGQNPVSQAQPGQEPQNDGWDRGYHPNPGYGQNATPNSYQTHYEQSQQNGYTVPQPLQKQPKKSGGKLAVGAVALVLVGALAGGGVSYLLSNSGDTEPAASASEESSTVATIGGETSAEEEQEDTVFHSTTIEITTNSKTTSMTPKDVYENYVNAVVAIANEGTSTNIFGQVSATASSGSGMIISSDGYILTNNHVVEGAEKLTVTMTSGEEYEATLIGADSDNDVALIKIEGTDFPTVAIGSSDDIQVGDQLCAIGNPLGELTNTLTVGYVSALDREINENGIPINMFQTDCAINSGNSGGPIFDMNGNVVGVTTAKYSTSSYSNSASIEGIGFCIPIDDAMDIVSDLLQYGYVRGRVSMGIMCQAIPSTVTQYYNLPAGIYVSTVQEGSAAENAGLKEGDIICALNGTEISSVTELKVLLKEYEPGDTVTLTVYQNESRQTVDMDITFDEMVSSSTTEEEETETQEPQQDETQQSGTYVYPFYPFGN